MNDIPERWPVLPLASSDELADTSETRPSETPSHPDMDYQPTPEVVKDPEDVEAFPHARKLLKNVHYLQKAPQLSKSQSLQEIDFIGDILVTAAERLPDVELPIEASLYKQVLKLWVGGMPAYEISRKLPGVTQAIARDCARDLPRILDELDYDAERLREMSPHKDVLLAAQPKPVPANRFKQRNVRNQVQPTEQQPATESVSVAGNSPDDAPLVLAEDTTVTIPNKQATKERAVTERRQLFEASKVAVDMFCQKFRIGNNSGLVLRALYIGDNGDFIDAALAGGGQVGGYEECKRKGQIALRTIIRNQRIAHETEPGQKQLAKPVLSKEEIGILELLAGSNSTSSTGGKSYDQLSDELKNGERIIIDGWLLTEKMLAELTLSAFRKINSQLEPTS